ncbi:MAG: hypothetical protein ACXVWU_08300 [Nocardioides sp.]
MNAARHRQVVQHAFRKRAVRLAVPAVAATLVTGGVVGVAVGLPGGGDVSARPAAMSIQGATDRGTGDSAYLADRVQSFSRSTQRTTLRALPKVTKQQYMNAPLNVWPQPREHGDPLQVLPWASRVGVTGVVRDGFAQIVLDRQVRWVTADYLQDTKPKPKPKPKPAASAPTTAGISDAPCPVSSGIESGLLPDADRVYRAVCAAFPQVTAYGGYRPDGEHSQGQAVDIMVYGDSATGQQIADWLQAHASEFNLYDIIWEQHIWTPVRASEGWRLMPDRGSPTANHMDHVHVAVNF